MRRSLIATLGSLLVATATFAAPAKPHEAWAAGVIERCDTSARSLVVKQGAHEMSFMLGTKAQILEGKQPLKVDELAKNVGHQVKVRYTTTNGSLVADRVEVSAHTATKAPGASARPPAKSHLTGR